MIIQIIQLSDHDVTCARFRRNGKELMPLFGIRLTLDNHAELPSLLTDNLTPVTEELHTILALPPSQIGLRELSLPLTDRKKLQAILPMELAGEIADEGAELICDALPLSEGSQLAGWATVPMVGELLRSLTEIGIEPEVVTCASLAWHLLTPDDCQEPIALVDDSALMICAQGRPLFCRLSSQMSDSVTPTLTAVELNKGITVERVFRLEGQAHAGEEKLPLPGPLAGPSVSGDLAPEAMIAPFAMALAFCSGEIFNLRNGPLAWTGKRSQLLRQFRLPLILGMVVLILLFSEATLRWYLLSKDIKSVNDSIAKIYKEAFPSRKKAVDETAEFKADIKRLRGGSTSSEVLAFLNLLAQAKNDQIQGVSEIEVDGERFKIKGDARSNTAIATMAQKLTTSGWSVDQPELTIRPDGMTLFVLKGHHGGTSP